MKLFEQEQDLDISFLLDASASMRWMPEGGGWLFIETAGDTTDEAVAAGRRLVKATACLDSAVATGRRAAALWRIREDGTGLAGRTPANAPAWLRGWPLPRRWERWISFPRKQPWSGPPP